MKKGELLLHTEVAIDSAHYLEGYEGNCKRIHGHTWFVEVWIKGTTDQKDSVGILFDFGNIKDLKDRYDHRLINELIPEEVNPTAENLIEIFYNDLKKIKPELQYKLRVYETKVGKETYCEYGDF